MTDRGTQVEETGLHLRSGAGGVRSITGKGRGWERHFAALPAATVWHLAVTFMVLPVAEHKWKRELPCTMPRASAEEHSDSEEEASLTKVSRPHAAHAAAQHQA